jgi:hypothetical protein
VGAVAVSPTEDVDPLVFERFVLVTAATRDLADDLDDTRERPPFLHDVTIPRQEVPSGTGAQRPQSL